MFGAAGINPGLGSADRGQQLPGQRRVIHPHFIGRRGVRPREMKGMCIMFQKEGLEVGQVVVLSEDSPDPFTVGFPHMVPLVALYSGKFVDQGGVDAEMLSAVGPWRLVFVGTDAPGQETGHLEIRVSQQGRKSSSGRYDLGQKRAVAIAHQQVGLFLLA